MSRSERRAARRQPDGAPAPPATGPAAPTYERWLPWILFAFAFLLYAQTVRYDYCLDDRMLITENKLTQQGVAGIPHILTTDSFFGYFGKSTNYVAGGRYRPLSQVVFALTWQLFGQSPAAGHLLNALFYACAGTLLFFVLRSLLGARAGSGWLRSVPFVATALFVAHPLHTEAVANIKGLDEILSLLWSLAALHLALRYAESRRARHFAAAAGAFLLALLSKEGSIAFLAVVPLARYVFAGATAAGSLPAALPLLPAVGAYAVLRINAVGLPQQVATTELLNNPFLHADLAQRYATVLATWGRYLKLLLVPHPLTHDYYPHHLRLVGWGDPWAWGSLLVCLGLLGWALAKIRDRSIAAFGVLFFAATFLLQSNLFFTIGTFMNERFLFVPVLGFALAAAWPACRASGRWRALAPALILALLAGYALKTVTRNEAWQNRLTLFSTDVRTSANSAKCNAALGEELAVLAGKEADAARKRQLYDRALAQLARAVELYPGYTIAWVLRGNAFLTSGDIGAAVDCYESALRIEPGHAHATNNLRVAAAQAREQGRPELSAKALAVLEKHQPKNPDALYARAVAQEAAGEFDTALSLLQEAVRADPKNYRAYNKIAQLLGNRKNDQAGALAALEKAAALTETDEFVWENLGVAYGIAGRHREAVAALEKSLKINPDNARAAGKLGDAYLASGDASRAEEWRARQRELAAKSR